MKNLSHHWKSIQGKLFPWLEEEIRRLSEKQQQLVTVLKFARVEQFIPYWHGGVGCPLKDRWAIARIYVAKAVYNMPTTIALIDRLQNDKSLRRLCGWERRDEIPHSSTFSRAFAEFAEMGLPSRVHEALIKTHRSKTLVGYISRDSTAIEGREKVCAEAKKKAKEKRQQKKRQRSKPSADVPSGEKNAHQKNKHG